MSEKKEHGALYLVGTPIGNLKDISFRALEVLRQVNLIAAEDTRHTRKLLSHYDIHTPLTSFHEHNEKKKAPSLIRKLKDGQSIALVSDAGMPGISDPGFYLVKLAVENNLKIVAIPGPCALILALVVSGFSTESFVFEGFLGRTSKERRKKLTKLINEERTIILYEAPHRISKLLPQIREILGDRHIVIGREMTKRFEEIIRGRISEVEKIFKDKKPRGEFTLVIEGKQALDTPEDSVRIKRKDESIYCNRTSR